MPGTDIQQVQAQDLQARQVLNRTLATADIMAASSLVRSDLRNKPEDVRAIALTLHQYGLPVGIQNINACYVVKGRVEFMTHLWVGLALRYGGHKVWLDQHNDAESATAWIERGDSGDRYSATFTMDDARRAGLADSETYRKYPMDMLGWRALSRVIKRYAPEISAGLGEVPAHDVVRSHPRPAPIPVDVEDDITDADIVDTGDPAASVDDPGSGGGSAIGMAPPAPSEPEPFDETHETLVSQGDRLSFYEAMRAALPGMKKPEADALRHAIVHRATRGRTVSSKAVLAGDEWERVLRVFAAFVDGKLELVEDDGALRLAVAEPVTEAS